MNASSEHIDDIDVRVLRLKPGDIVVLKAKRPLPRETVERIQAMAEQMLFRAGHIGVKIAVLDDSMDLDVLRKAEGLG